jgi:O-Antigen ligase
LVTRVRPAILKVYLLRVDSFLMRTVDQSLGDQTRVDQRSVSDRRRSHGSPKGSQPSITQLLPFAIPLTLVSASSQLQVGQVPFFWLCNALVVLGALAVGVRSLAKTRRVNATPLSTAVTLFVAVVVSGNAFNPGSGLFQLVTAIVGAAVLAGCTSQLVSGKSAVPLIRTLSGFLLVQVCIGLAQISADGPVGPSWFSESEFSFRRIGGVLSPSGSLIHTNTLASFATVAMAALVALLVRNPLSRVDRLVGSAAVVLGSGLVGLTMCRSAFISLLALLIGCVFAKQRRQVLPLLLCSLVALAGSFFVRSDAWSTRAAATVASAESSGSGRMALNRQAIAIFSRSPIVGVGPGNYLNVVADHDYIKEMSVETYIVHNVWLYVLATLGIVGATTFAALCLLVAWRCFRNGAWSVVMLAVIAPSLALDTALFDYQGLIWLGIGLGVALGLRRDNHHQLTDQ